MEACNAQPSSGPSRASGKRGGRYRRRVSATLPTRMCGNDRLVRKQATTQVELVGTYRIAIAPEPNRTWLTNFKSIRFESPENNVGPWPASLGCTTNSYSSISPNSANASGSLTPPTNSPFPGSCLSCRTASPRSPRTSSAFQSTRSSVLETTYFFAASIVRANLSTQSGLAPAGSGGRNASSIIS